MKQQPLARRSSGICDSVSSWNEQKPGAINVFEIALRVPEIRANLLPHVSAATKRPNKRVHPTTVQRDEAGILAIRRVSRTRSDFNLTVRVSSLRWNGRDKDGPRGDSRDDGGGKGSGCSEGASRTCLARNTTALRWLPYISRTDDELPCSAHDWPVMRQEFPTFSHGYRYFSYRTLPGPSGIPSR